MPGVFVLEVLYVVLQLFSMEQTAVQLADVALGSGGASRGQRNAVLLQLVVLHRRVLRELPGPRADRWVLQTDPTHERLHLWKKKKKKKFKLTAYFRQ